jgi:hypothetical protein
MQPTEISDGSIRKELEKILRAPGWREALRLRYGSRRNEGRADTRLGGPLKEGGRSTAGRETAKERTLA